jgi:hypothetical protein
MPRGALALLTRVAWYVFADECEQWIHDVDARPRRIVTERAHAERLTCDVETIAYDVHVHVAEDVANAQSIAVHDTRPDHRRLRARAGAMRSAALLSRRPTASASSISAIVSDGYGMPRLHARHPMLVIFITHVC